MLIFLIHRAKIFLLIIAISLISEKYVFSQTPEIDSLNKLLESHFQEDTQKVNILNELGAKYLKIDMNKNKKYLEQAYKIADSLNFQKGIAENYRQIGMYYDIKSKYDSALIFFKSSLEIFNQINDKNGVSSNYNNIGAIYWYKGDYDSALVYFKKSLEIFEEIDFEIGKAKSYNNIGLIYMIKGDYPNSIDYFKNSLELKEKLEDKSGIASCYNNIGLIFINQEDYGTALEYYLKTLEIYFELSDKSGIANTYNNIGFIYLQFKNYSTAYQYFIKALQLYIEQNNTAGIVLIYNNLAKIYTYEGNYEKSLEYLNKSLELSIEIGSKSYEARNYYDMAKLYFQDNNISKALSNSLKAYELSTEIGEAELIKESAQILSETYFQQENYKEAYYYLDLAKGMSDSLLNEKNIQKIAEYNYQYKYEKEKLEQEKKEEIRLQEEKRKNILLYTFIGAFVLMSFLVLLIFRLFLNKKRVNKILTIRKNEIAEKNEELVQLNEEIEFKNKELTKKNHEIIIHQEKIEHSIQYASKIQIAVLPSHLAISKILKNYFVFYKPKDIVSGDFYFIKQVNEFVLVAAADCTGHGVPGAFMSMLGFSFLIEIVSKREITSASQVLDELRDCIKLALNQQNNIYDQNDGIDIAFCEINKKNLLLSYAGAFNPCWIFRNAEENSKPNFFELTPDYQPIGVFLKEKPFSQHQFQLKKNDIVYVFSDGFQSQLSEKNAEKYKLQNFKKFISDNIKTPLHLQKDILEMEFKKWKGKAEQTDDVLVFGFKI